MRNVSLARHVVETGSFYVALAAMLWGTTPGGWTHVPPGLVLDDGYQHVLSGLSPQGWSQELKSVCVSLRVLSRVLIQGALRDIHLRERGWINLGADIHGPLIVAVAESMRNRRRPRAVDLVLSILVFLGAYISTNPSLTVASPTGFMIGFLLALTYSATLMVPKELYARGSSRNEVIVQSSISATLALTPVVLLLDGVRLVAESLPPIVYGGVICMGVAVILFYEGLKSINPMRAGLITTLEPVTSLILSRAVLGEALQPLQYVGAGIIVIVAMITTLTPHRE